MNNTDNPREVRAQATHEDSTGVSHVEDGGRGRALHRLSTTLRRRR